MIKEVCLFTCDETLVEDFECDYSRLEKDTPRLILLRSNAFASIFAISYIKSSG